MDKCALHFYVKHICIWHICNEICCVNNIALPLYIHHEVHILFADVSGNRQGHTDRSALFVFLNFFHRQKLKSQEVLQRRNIKWTYLAFSWWLHLHEVELCWSFSSHWQPSLCSLSLLNSQQSLSMNACFVFFVTACVNAVTVTPLFEYDVAFCHSESFLLRLYLSRAEHTDQWD